MSIASIPEPSLAQSSLNDVLDAIDRAETGGVRLQAAAEQLRLMGFDQVTISLRDESLNPTLLRVAGPSPGADAPLLTVKPLPGAVWRRRLPHLDRFKVGNIYFLDGSDDWVAREFFGSEPSAQAADERWLPTDLIVGLMRGTHQEVIGVVKLASAHDGRRPDSDRLGEIGVVIRHLEARVAHDALDVLARRRHERLLLLQEAGSTLTRSLDEQEIVRELMRQVQRAVRCDGVTVAVPDLQNDRLTPMLRVAHNVERMGGPVRLGAGLIAEVARSGHSVRAGDREADRAREKSGLGPPLTMDDIVGEAGPATSAVVVPMRVGIRLMAVLAVYSARADMYTAEDEEMLATIAAQAATALANARRYAESERERRTTEALADVARAVGESLRLGEVLRLTLRHSVSLLGVEGAGVALRTGDYLNVVAAAGSADVLRGVHLPLYTGQLGRCVLENEMIVLNGIDEDAPVIRMIQQLTPVQRVVMAPLGTGRGTIGAIAVINRERPFDFDDARVLRRLADQVAVAIDNARLFEEVEKATREWKLAFDSTASGIVVLEEALTVSRCNARAAELCGTSITDLLGRRFRDALGVAAASPEASLVEAGIARALREGIPVRETIRDPVHGRLLALLISGHPAGGCVISFDDVTESTRLAEQHRNVLEAVPDAIVISRLDGHVDFANPAARALFQREDLVGSSIDRLIPSEWLPSVSARETAARGGARVRYECEVLRVDGTRRTVQVSSTPMLELGVIRGTVACLRDITDQRADALARERSEVLYSRLVESASDAIFTLDVRGQFTSINQGFLNETGLSRETALALTFDALVDEVDRVKATDVMHATFRGERRKLHLRYISRRGTRTAMVTTAPIHEGGQVVGVLGIVRDMTSDEIRHEAQLQQARLAAVGQSLGRMADDLRNPLASILAAAGRYADSSTLSASDRQTMAQILAEARRASDMIDQVLDTTCMTPVTGARTEVDIGAVVQRSLGLFSRSFKGLGIQVSISLPDVPPRVYGDPLQLEQVLVNLLTNAEQALAETDGNRTLEIDTRVEEDNVVLRIHDGGPGILPHHLPHVMDPMFTTRSGLGQRGLGLTIASAIVRDHGGRMDIASSAGDGVTVLIRIPVAGAPALVDGRFTPRSIATLDAIVEALVPTATTSCASVGPMTPEDAKARIAQVPDTAR